jgi:hypothetical protein
VLPDDHLGQSGPDEAAQIPHPADHGWTELCAKLIEEFPSLDAHQVINEVTHAREATQLFGVDSAEQRRLAASMARNNLTLLSGGADLARLDPERHVRVPRA